MTGGKNAVRQSKKVNIGDIGWNKSGNLLRTNFSFLATATGESKRKLFEKGEIPARQDGGEAGEESLSDISKKKRRGQSERYATGQPS